MQKQEKIQKYLDIINEGKNGRDNFMSNYIEKIKCKKSSEPNVSSERLDYHFARDHHKQAKINEYLIQFHDRNHFPPD